MDEDDDLLTRLKKQRKAKKMLAKKSTPSGGGSDAKTVDPTTTATRDVDVAAGGNATSADPGDQPRVTLVTGLDDIPQDDDDDDNEPSSLAAIAQQLENMVEDVSTGLTGDLEEKHGADAAAAALDHDDDQAEENRKDRPTGKHDLLDQLAATDADDLHSSLTLEAAEDHAASAEQQAHDTIVHTANKVDAATAQPAASSPQQQQQQQQSVAASQEQQVNALLLEVVSEMEREKAARGKGHVEGSGSGSRSPGRRSPREGSDDEVDVAAANKQLLKEMNAQSRDALKEAMSAHQAKKYNVAVEKYATGLEYLGKALGLETDADKRAAMKNRFERYLVQAERAKALSKGTA